MTTMPQVSMEDIKSAQHVIAGVADHTPLVPSPFMTAHCGGDFLLKLENMQPIGAFKIRGAMTAIAALPQDVPGVTCFSTEQPWPRGWLMPRPNVA